MSKNTENRKSSKESKKNRIKFEETNEGQMLLNSLSAAFYKVRKENKYRGEVAIMQNLTKRANQTNQIMKTDGELERVAAKKTKIENDSVANEAIIAQIYRQEGYIRTTPPKN